MTGLWTALFLEYPSNFPILDERRATVPGHCGPVPHWTPALALVSKQVCKMADCPTRLVSEVVFR